MTTPAGGRVSVPALRVVAWPIDFGGVFGGGTEDPATLGSQDVADYAFADENIDSRLR